MSKLVELNDVISHLEQKLANEIALNEELKNRFNKWFWLISTIVTSFLRSYAQSLNTVSEQNTIDFFSKLLEEKDQKIIFLQKQNEFLNVYYWSVVDDSNMCWWLEQGKAISAGGWQAKRGE